MIHRRVHLALVIVSTIFLTPSVAGVEHGTRPLFVLDPLGEAPFPSDWFTLADETQNTGRRVSLPLPDCTVNVSDCEDFPVINALDGFNLQPRLSIPFSGPIDANTITSDTVFLISLGSTIPVGDYMPWGTKVGIDQVVWDASTNTVHVESDALLPQHTRFALIVARGVRDDHGALVKTSDAFQGFRTSVRGYYKQALLDAVYAARRRGLEEDDILVASVFTTQSATATLEKVRDEIHTETPEPADFSLGPPNGERTVYTLDELLGVTWRRQTGVNPSVFSTVTLPLDTIRNSFPGAVGSVAFGRFRSSDYEVPQAGYIPPVGTRSGSPAVQRTNDIYFNLYVPSGPAPPSGWPIAIIGHGVNGSKNIPAPNVVDSLDVVSAMAAHGVATIAINAVGNGGGAESTLTVQSTTGATVTFSAGGRSIDQNGDHIIGPNEGSSAVRPRGIVFLSDGFRQTAADLMQLARVIEMGMDVDGDGLQDLDPARIYYAGGSWSAGYGTVFFAVEPHVRAAVLTAPVDPVPIGLGLVYRRVLGAMLASRQPSLLNAPGIRAFDGVPVPLTPNLVYFDENLPLRDRIPVLVDLMDDTTRVIQSPVTTSVEGAVAIQEMFDRYEWVSQAGSPVAYAPLIRKAPPSSGTTKMPLYVMLKGDQSVQNPTTTAILRAGELADRTMYYRHDLARADSPFLQANPHGFRIDSIAPVYRQLTAIFFETDGAQVIRPEPGRYFEFPIPLPLPEGLNYMR